MELANILELIHAVSDSDLTEFNLQDDTLNISMSKEKTIVQQMAVNTDPADAQQYQPVVQQAVHVESVNAVNDEVQTGSVVKYSSCRYLLCSIFSGKSPLCKSRR